MGHGPPHLAGYGFLPGMFGGFLLADLLAPHAGFADGYSYGAEDYGGGDFGGGGFL